MKRAKSKKFDKGILKCLSVLLLISVVACAFYLTLNIALKYRVIGDDFRFHLKAAEIYASGRNALFDEGLLKAFGGPYPPVFHLFLAIFVKLGIAMTAASFMQALFYPLVLLSAAFLVWKKKGVVAAAFTVALMFSSIALFDRSQVIPQSIDMILFPLAVYFFLENKRVPFAILMLLMVYSHGYLAIIPLLGVGLFSFIEKKNRDSIWIVILLSLPLIATLLGYMRGYIALRNEPNLLFFDPMFLISYFGLQLTFFLPLSLIYLFAERKNLDALDKLAVYWLLATFLLIWKFPDRFASYAVMPASIIISKMLARFSRINKFVGIFLLLELFFFGFYTNFLKWFNMLHGLSSEMFNRA